MDRPLIDGDGAPAKTGNPLRAIGRFKASFWMLTVGCLAVYGNVLPFNNVASSLLMERTYFQPTPPGCALTDPDRCESPSNPPLPTCPNATDVAPPLPRVADIGGKTYHNLTKDDVVCTDDAWSAAGACTHEFCARQAAAEAFATEVMSIPYVISAVGTPFIGLAVDRFGGRALLAALCPLMLVIAHVLLGFVATLPPELPLVLQGVAFAFFATALWPSVPYTVPAESEGLAFGVVTALQNGGLGLFPLLVSLAPPASPPASRSTSTTARTATSSTAQTTSRRSRLLRGARSASSWGARAARSARDRTRLRASAAGWQAGVKAGRKAGRKARGKGERALADALREELAPLLKTASVEL